ncbi:unnamed protein product, partial [Ixodes persulcatus]
LYHRWSRSFLAMSFPAFSLLSGGRSVTFKSRNNKATWSLYLASPAKRCGVSTMFSRWKQFLKQSQGLPWNVCFAVPSLLNVTSASMALAPSLRYWSTSLMEFTMWAMLKNGRSS